MRCPFLREAQVKFCRASAYRKMITRGPGQQGAERCSSAEYIHCPAAKQHHEESPSTNHCPFLQESLVQYCAAAPVIRYIPYSESSISPCGTTSHTYCELFLAIDQPAGTAAGDEPGSDPAEDAAQRNEQSVDGLKVPGRLSYTPNHLWLAISADEVFHIGIDAFAAKAIGGADRLSFITQKGLHYPTAVLTVKGVDLQIVFPRQVLVTRTNAYLRTNPAKIFSHPYSLGWLFEGTVATGFTPENAPSPVEGTISGASAGKWMKDECRRMNTLAHKFSTRPDRSGRVSMADGGTFAGGLMQELSRDEILHVFNEFFSPFAHRRPQS